MPDVLLEEHLPSRSVPRSRPYSNIVFEPSTALIVAASVIQAKFASFDEDGNRLWEPDGMWLSFLPALCIFHLMGLTCSRSPPALCS